MLARHKTLFFIEVHSWADPGGQQDQSEVYELMANAGYEKKSIKGKIFFSPSRQATADPPSDDSGGGILKKVMNFFRSDPGQ